MTLELQIRTKIQNIKMYDFSDIVQLFTVKTVKFFYIFPTDTDRFRHNLHKYSAR